MDCIIQGVAKSQDTTERLSYIYIHIRLHMGHPIFPPTFRSNDNPQCIDDTHDLLLSCSSLLMLSKVQNSTRWLCMLSHFSHVWLFVALWTVAPRLFCPWDSPGKNTGMGCHALLQGIFLTQGSNPYLLCLLLWQSGSLPLTLPRKLRWLIIGCYPGSFATSLNKS